MNIRLRYFLISIPQLIVFTIISLGLILILFHAAVLSFPVLAFIWTFYGFSIFTVITGVPLKISHTAIFATFNLIYLSIALVIFICGFEDTKNELLRNILIIALLPVTIFYIFFLIKMFKLYRPNVKNEFKKLFKVKDKIDNNNSDQK